MDGRGDREGTGKGWGRDIDLKIWPFRSLPLLAKKVNKQTLYKFTHR